jgi:hypothetical protein
MNDFGDKIDIVKMEFDGVELKGTNKMEIVCDIAKACQIPPHYLGESIDIECELGEVDMKVLNKLFLVFNLYYQILAFLMTIFQMHRKCGRNVMKLKKSVFLIIIKFVKRVLRFF